jgi:hypothetical protein
MLPVIVQAKTCSCLRTCLTKSMCGFRLLETTCSLGSEENSLLACGDLSTLGSDGLVLIGLKKCLVSTFCLIPLSYSC